MTLHLVAAVKIHMQEFTSVKELIEKLRLDLEGIDTPVIGIDGTDGVGKTTLASQIGDAFKLPVIYLDDFLEPERGSYVAYLCLEDVREKLRLLNSPVVIEGVCLLRAAERIGVEITHHIYIKRIRYGIWRDEETCDPLEPVEDLLSRLTEDLRVFAKSASYIEGEKWSHLGNNIKVSPLREEVIRYHA